MCICLPPEQVLFHYIVVRLLVEDWLFENLLNFATLAPTCYPYAKNQACTWFWTAPVFSAWANAASSPLVSPLCPLICICLSRCITVYNDIFGHHIFQYYLLFQNCLVLNEEVTRSVRLPDNSLPECSFFPALLSLDSRFIF